MLAYPIELRDEIAWYRGRVNSDQVSFNPAEVNKKLVFTSLQEFKLEGANRFADFLDWTDPAPISIPAESNTDGTITSGLSAQR